MAVNPNVDRPPFCHARPVEESLQKKFGRRLAEEMKARSVSGGELARRVAGLGEKFGVSTISRIKNGLQNPSLDVVDKICRAMDLPAWFLMTDDAQVEQRVIKTPSQKVVSLGVKYPSALPNSDKKIEKTKQKSRRHSG